MNKIAKGSQVMLRVKARGPLGASTTVVRIGEVLSLKDDNYAEVVFASAGNTATSRTVGVGSVLNGSRKLVPVSSLELVEGRFGGRKVVQVDPNRRAIGSLIR